ncbi:MULTISPECIES: hypothetical protein [unclassified Caballeronia]|uniref:hypothetical protein n=1 Tax=unclassified Caballeronia TaxID=2646786 RepID=UPI002860FBFC|nr:MULTISPECIES: hypothetical protein [unclassified Caballeronia]MDR5750235.1 hypothetical protein [Caballeronia sp. LZ024]MDR5842636.1 hypothetical protein [Caballeronia sp. LZ031]
MNAVGWTNPVLEELMSHAQWSTTADDNARDETIPISFYERIVEAYNTNPNDDKARRNLGLLALTVGVSEWGVSGVDEAQLPDSRNTKWSSNSNARQGKHVMSYDLGGIGISHLDSDELGHFIEFVAQNFVTDAARAADKTELLKLVDPANYLHKRIQYDQIRASGLCGSEPVTADLFNEPFNADKDHPGVSKENCSDWDNKKHMNPKTWQLFRTYMRMALRSQKGQEWIFNSWLDGNWTRSLNHTLAHGGSVEEALANARVRNSAPVRAEAALSMPSGDDTALIQREIDAYAQMNDGVTARRRYPFIMRSVNLYRFLDKKPLLTGVRRP